MGFLSFTRRCVRKANCDTALFQFAPEHVGQESVTGLAGRNQASKQDWGISW